MHVIYCYLWIYFMKKCYCNLCTKGPRRQILEICPGSFKQLQGLPFHDSTVLLGWEDRWVGSGEVGDACSVLHCILILYQIKSTASTKTHSSLQQQSIKWSS